MKKFEKFMWSIEPIMEKAFWFTIGAATVVIIFVLTIKYL